MKRFVILLFAIVLLAGCGKESEEQPALVREVGQRKVVLSEVYLACEHCYTIGTVERPSTETRDELAKIYQDFDEISLGEGEARLTRYKKGKCDGHVLFRSYRGKIGVFKENNGALMDVLDVSLSTLPNEDQRKLKEGVSVFGEEERAAFLDDFEA